MRAEEYPKTAVSGDKLRLPAPPRARRDRAQLQVAARPRKNIDAGLI
jgi:hypothetical protein